MKKKILNLNKNLKIILIVILGTTVIIIGSLIIYSKTLKPENNIKYSLIYYDDTIPGSKRNIRIYNDKIDITTTRFCNAIDCGEQKPKKEVFNYSTENLNKLSKFINDNFSTKENIIEIQEHDLNEYQKEVIQGLLLGEYFFEINIEECKYKIEYSENDNLYYIIYFKNDGSILIKKLNINSDYDIVKVDAYSLNFSKRSLNILNDYIEKQVKKENSKTIYKPSTLKKDEINIFNSIVKNDETYLNNIQDEAKLIYAISYNGINCYTPTLYLYNDNTYEYFYTFGTSDEKLIPKIGTYNYDITKIIENIDKYEENSFGPYYIIDENEKSYTTYNTNTELQGLLKSLDITLEKCLEQQ